MVPPESDAPSAARPCARSFEERHRFGRVARIPTPTPFPVGDINSYLVLPPAGSDELTLIDTGVRTPDAFSALRTGMKELGHAIEDIRRILITHGHMDHFGQARRIQDLCGAPIYASEIEAAQMRIHWSPSGRHPDHVRRWMHRFGVPDEIATRRNPEAERMAQEIQEPIEVDGTLAEGDRIELGAFEVEVIETPGHCDGHIVFYECDTRTLFSGDHLLTDISPVPLLSLPEDEGTERGRSLVRFMESLARVEALACDRVFPSHGDVIYDHRQLIAGYRLHHERRKLQILRHLEDGATTAFELARRMFPKYVESQLYLVMSEVVGHLDLLEDEGSIAIETGDGADVVRALAAA